MPGAIAHDAAVAIATDKAARDARWGGHAKNSQRCLAFLESLVNAKVIREGASMNSRGVMAEVKKAHAILEVGERDIERLWLVMRAAWRGDKVAAECIARGRSGERKSGEAVFTLWKRLKRAALSEKALRAAKTRIADDNKDVCRVNGPKIDAAVKAALGNRSVVSDGQRALAFVEALIESGVCGSSGKDAKRGTRSLNAEKVESLGVTTRGVMACLTLIRVYPDFVEKVRSGDMTPQMALEDAREQTRQSSDDTDPDDMKPSEIDLEGFDLDSFADSTTDQIAAAATKKDLAHALSDILAATNSGLDAIRIAASESMDREVLDLTKKAQAGIGLMKMTAVHLVTTRAGDKAHTTRQEMSHGKRQ